MNNLNIDIITNDFEINFKNKILDFCNYIYKSFDFKNTAFLAIEFCNSEQIKEINTKYRDKQTDTDVLSFEYYNNLAKNKNQYTNQILNLGDILISVNYAKEQAKSLNNTFEEEVLFLICHGFLHLLGYDHLNSQDEIEMLTMQKKLYGDFHTRHVK